MGSCFLVEVGLVIPHYLVSSSTLNFFITPGYFSDLQPEVYFELLNPPLMLNLYFSPYLIQFNTDIQT